MHKAGLHLQERHETLEVYQRSEVDKANSLIGLVSMNIITRQEARDSLGLKDDTPSSAVNMAEAQPVDTTQVTDVAEQKAAVTADIRKLGAVAKTRLGEAKMHKVVAFKSDVLAPTRLEHLKTRLMACESVAEIDRVIGEALLIEPSWVDNYGEPT